MFGIVQNGAGNILLGVTYIKKRIWVLFQMEYKIALGLRVPKEIVERVWRPTQTQYC